MKRSVFTTALAATLGLSVGISISTAGAQEQSPKTQTVRDFPDLVGGLRSTPGCLGVETVAAKDGKQMVIMAWFQNKKAVEGWYYSQMHRGAMSKFFAGGVTGRKPLDLFKDEKKPVLVIASVTPSDKPAVGRTLAISQIAIEMYTPVPGGIALGGGFAPNSLSVEGLVRLPMADPGKR